MGERRRKNCKQLYVYLSVCVCVCHLAAFDGGDDDITLQHLVVGLCLHVGMKQSRSDLEVRLHQRLRTQQNPQSTIVDIQRCSSYPHRFPGLLDAKNRMSSRSVIVEKRKQNNHKNTEMITGSNTERL